MEQEQLKEVGVEQISKMSIDEIIDLFNPTNAQYLSDGALQYLPRLTDDQIAALAAKYPNKNTGNTYLILKDMDKKPTDKQLYPRSTWANLKQLRGGSALNFVAINFASRFKSETVNIPTDIKVAPVQDLTNAEKTALPGLKTAETQTSQAIPTENTVSKPLEPIAAPQTENVVNVPTSDKQPVNEPATTEIGTNAAIGADLAEPEFEDLSAEAAKQAEQTDLKETENTVTVSKKGKGK